MPPAAPAEAAPPPRRLVSINLPVVSENRQYGEVLARIDGTDAAEVDAASLATVLAPLLSDAGRARIAELGSGLLPVARLAEAGVEVRLDPATLALVVAIAPAIRAPLGVAGVGDPSFVGLDPVYPAGFSAGLTASLLATDQFDDARGPTSSVFLSGFANLGGADGFTLVYGATVGLANARRFQRDRIVLFRDNPARALRMSAGDLSPRLSRIIGTVDLAGVSIERSYQDLQPLRNVRPTGRRSFTLERPSTVEIYVNGALLQRFEAPPGPVDLRGIASSALTSEVSIFVEDALGRREIDRYLLSNDIVALGAGISEFSFAAGVLREQLGFGFDYATDPVVTGYYARGLSDRLTVVGFGAAAEHAQNIGGGVAWAGLRGLVQFEAALGNGRGRGVGAAAGFIYRGDPFALTDRGGQMNIQIDWQSRDYRRLESFNLADDIRLDAVADYRFDLTDRTTLGVGASYYTVYGRPGSDLGLFATLTQSFGRLSLSATARHFRPSFGPDETGVLVTLSMPFGRNHSAFASYDTASRAARAEFRRRRSLTLPEFEYAVRASHDRRQEELGASAAFGTSRFSVAADVDHRRFAGDSGTRGTLRLTTGIGYADGRLAIGRDPGRGFTLVSRHPSLGDARIAVSTGGRVVAEANGFGPAIVPTLSPHRPQPFTVAPRDLPEGYDIGAGEYVVFPGARTGAHVRIGDDNNRTILAILVDERGEPIALATGTLVPADGGNAIPVFTNRSGRLFASNLAPGRYRLTIDGSDAAREIEVGGDAGSLTDLGRLTMGTQP